MKPVLAELDILTQKAIDSARAKDEVQAELIVLREDLNKQLEAATEAGDLETAALYEAALYGGFADAEQVKVRDLTDRIIKNNKKYRPLLEEY